MDSKRDIYFAGSIRGGRQDVHLYHQIIQELKTNYGDVLTEFVGDSKITDEEGSFKRSPKEIHDNDLSMLQKCQYLVAEVTTPSLGVGYEIATARCSNKNILCLFRPGGKKLLSLMIDGAKNGTTFLVKEYKDLEDVKDILKEYFSTR